MPQCQRSTVGKILLWAMAYLLIWPSPGFSNLDPGVLKVICHIGTPWVIGNQVVEPLLSVDNDNQFIPCLAESYEMHDTHMDLQLREGILFQDGTPFNASAVRMNWEAYQKTARPFFSIDLRRAVKDIAVLSNHRVRLLFQEDGLIGLIPVYLRSFYLYSPSYFKHSQGVYPPGIQVSLSKAGLWGTGPYIAKTILSDGESTILERNPHYWQKDRPIIPKLVIFGSKNIDEVAAHRLMKLGQADLFDAVAPSMLPILARSPSMSLVIKRPVSRLNAIFNLRKPQTPLQDIRVRKALNFMVDRRTLFKYLGGGSARMTPFLLPPSTNDERLQPYPYRPEDAKSLLEAAGYSSSRPLALTIGYSFSGKKLAHAIAAMLEEGNIKVSFQEYRSRLEWYEHFFDIFHNTANPMENETWDINIIEIRLYTNSVATYFGESFISKGGHCWIPADPQADDLFFQAMRHKDRQVAEESLRELEKYLYHQFYMMPIYISPTILAVNNRIAGNSFSSSGYLLNLKEVAIDATRP